jgi:hypothetical protein
MVQGSLPLRQAEALLDDGGLAAPMAFRFFRRDPQQGRTVLHPSLAPIALLGSPNAKAPSSGGFFYLLTKRLDVTEWQRPTCASSPRCDGA